MELFEEYRIYQYFLKKSPKKAQKSVEKLNTTYEEEIKKKENAKSRRKTRSRENSKEKRINKK